MIDRRFCVVCCLSLLLGTGRNAAQAADAAAELKPPLAGLVDMGDIGFHRQDGGLAHPQLDHLRSFPGIFGGVVINITWQQLEPDRGQLVTQDIDKLLGELRVYNQANPQHPAGARLRVWPGPNAPVWAKSVGGPPVAVRHKDMPITVGRFWTQPYRDAWRDLQKRLAARYDAEPLIREVTNTSGATMTDESVLLPADPESLRNLLAAGFSDKQFQACLLESSLDYAGWATTCIEQICNPYRTMDSGTPKVDMEFTLKLMQHWRQTLGPRGVLSHHSLSSPLVERLVPIYEEMRRLGPPIALQTHSPAGLDWEGALRTGLSYKAGSIELWSGTRFGGFETKDLPTLRRWAMLFPSTGE
jgi:hypothetical protein